MANAEVLTVLINESHSRNTCHDIGYELRLKRAENVSASGVMHNAFLLSLRMALSEAWRADNDKRHAQLGNTNALVVVMT